MSVLQTSGGSAVTFISDTIAYFMNPCRGLAPDEVIFGESEAMGAVRQKLEKIAGTNVPVLIRGEIGTGKETIARLVHRLYPGEDAPFLKLNSPVARGSLLDELMFDKKKEGLGGQENPADHGPDTGRWGTLFVDEVADLDPCSQSKLLRLFQEEQSFAIGGPRGIPVKLRILCATSRNLEREAESKNFRQDLLYSINVVMMYLPPLRDRRMDIPLLVEYFLELYKRKFGCNPPPPSTRMIELLQRHEWPGNIRELENLVKRYVLLGSEEFITSELLDTTPRWADQPSPCAGAISLKKVTRDAARELERKIILKTLQDNRGNRKEAARALNISYRALLYKIKEAGVPPKRASLWDPITQSDRQGQRG